MILPAAARAKSSIEEIGDFTQFIVPAYAFGLAMGEEGYKGAHQFMYSYGATFATVHALKQTIDAERPDGSDNKSFPSGHTSSAFSGATFIHKRYGLKQAAVPYALATFTGWSRIYADKHHTRDVVAGAAISAAFTWILVDEYSGFSVSASPGGARVGYRKEF